MIRFFLILFTLFILPLQAFALSSEWVRTDAASVRLISGINGVGDGNVIPLGLDVALANGWHTYWRSPGEAGLPPQLDWSKSQSEENNLESAALLYPAPRRYTAYGLETVGYRDHVLFPIDVTLRHKGQALNATVAVDLLVCSSICVPKHFDLALVVPVGAPVAAVEAQLLHNARDQLPASPENAGLLVKSIVNEGQSLTVTVSARNDFIQPDIFVENDSNIGFGAPVVSIDTTTHTATMTVKAVDTLPEGKKLAGMPMVFTLVDGERATEIKTKIPAATVAPVVEPKEEISLTVALLFALIGGFILNLMPCVLPVLSLKILSVASHGGGQYQ